MNKKSLNQDFGISKKARTLKWNALASILSKTKEVGFVAVGKLLKSFKINFKKLKEEFGMELIPIETGEFIKYSSKFNEFNRPSSFRKLRTFNELQWKHGCRQHRDHRWPWNGSRRSQNPQLSSSKSKVDDPLQFFFPLVFCLSFFWVLTIPGKIDNWRHVGHLLGDHSIDSGLLQPQKWERGHFAFEYLPLHFHYLRHPSSFLCFLSILLRRAEFWKRLGHSDLFQVVQVLIDHGSHHHLSGWFSSFLGLRKLLFGACLPYHVWSGSKCPASNARM